MTMNNLPKQHKKLTDKPSIEQLFTIQTGVEKALDIKFFYGLVTANRSWISAGKNPGALS